MEYPREFSAQARARVEAERLRADWDLEECGKQPQAQTRRRRSYGPAERLWTDAEEDLHNYILRVFLAFAREACEPGKQGIWAVDRIRSEADEFLRRVTIEAYYEKGYDRSGRRFPEVVSHWDGSLLPEVEQKFHKSDEWRRFESELLTVAERQSADNPQPGGPDRRAEVDAFILKCNQETSLKATRTHIWRAAGHGSARQFQFWQGSDPKATAQDGQNFRRILALSPTDFVALLKKKDIT